jgi:hypothetical protein
MDLSLKEALVYLMSGGTGAVVFWLMENVPFLKNLASDYKRYVSIALSAVLPVGAWLIMLGMGYEQAPEAWQGWVERIFALIAAALIISQGLHGALRLRKRRTG